MKNENIVFIRPKVGGPSNKRIEEAKHTLDLHNTAKKKQIENTKIKCTTQIATGKGCDKFSLVKDCTLIEWLFYDDDPYSGRWYTGEIGWKCPLCGHLNRLYKTEELKSTSEYFKHPSEQIQNK